MRPLTEEEILARAAIRSYKRVEFWANTLTLAGITCVIVAIILFFGQLLK